MILSLSLCPLSRSSLFPYTTLFRSPVLLQHRSAPSAVDDDRLVSLAERRDIRPGECRGVRRGRRADRRQQRWVRSDAEGVREIGRASCRERGKNARVDTRREIKSYQRTEQPRYSPTNE